MVEPSPKLLYCPELYQSILHESALYANTDHFTLLPCNPLPGHLADFSVVEMYSRVAGSRFMTDNYFLQCIL